MTCNESVGVQGGSESAFGTADTDSPRAEQGRLPDQGNSPIGATPDSCDVLKWPRPVRLGERAVGWPASEVAALNAARIAGKTDQEIRALVVKLEAARKAAA